MGRIVVERLAYLTDRRVNPLLHIDENILAPEFAGDLLARHQLSVSSDEEHQQLQGQSLEPNHAAAAGQLKAAKVQHEIVELDFLLGHACAPRRPQQAQKFWAAGAGLSSQPQGA